MKAQNSSNAACICINFLTVEFHLLCSFKAIYRFLKGLDNPINLQYVSPSLLTAK